MHPLPCPRCPPAHAVIARHHSPVNTEPTALGRGSWRGLRPSRGHFWWGGGEWGGGHRFVIISFVESTDFPVIGFRNTRVLRGAGVCVCGGDMGEAGLGEKGQCWWVLSTPKCSFGALLASVSIGGGTQGLGNVTQGRERTNAGNAAAGLFLQPGASATKKIPKNPKDEVQFPGQSKTQPRPGSREELAPKQPPAAPPLHGESGEGDQENRGDILG